MKTLTALVVGMLLFQPSIAWAKPTEREQVVLRRLYQEYVRRRLSLSDGNSHAVGNSMEEIRRNADSAKSIEVRRSAILTLVGYSDNDTVQTLLRVLRNNDDDVCRFYAACVLARHGNVEGLSVLQDAAVGKLLLSQAGFEVSEGGLGILMLGQDLPKGFSFRKPVNAIFSELEVFVVNAVK